MMRTNSWIALVALGLTSSVSLADVKIGYVDMQRAHSRDPGRQKAKKELEESFNKKKKELEKFEADIKKKGEEFEKRSMAMNEDARGKKQNEIQAEMRKYQEMAAKSQMEIQKQERDLTQPIVTKLRANLDVIAEKEGYTMILEKNENAVMYAKKDSI